MTTFAVCRTAEIPSAVIDRFLSVTYAESEKLAPGLGPCLIVLPGGKNDDSGSSDNVGSMTTTTTTTTTTRTTTPSSAADLAPSPFIGMSVPEVAEQLGVPRNRFFVVMDSRSAEDDTVVLVTATASDVGTTASKDEDPMAVQTARATFASAQSVLVGLDMGTQGFDEVRSIAAGSPGGVYGPERRGDGGPRKGGPAPRVRLGAALIA
ncbi:uncharacterized protein B0T15DRAFT_431598 [Chaetomium strumarium]|uniref:Uncharacterized protein n=1 Tax=Chaetomium strumarium TaxID=1170767 RepID=A0AAJ0M2W8_9PEZI|nr:hypothetical protein B0T15DRAFT_431598 [Chaetomium strumarium]